MTQNFLFEVGCEEIPARFFPSFLNDFKTQLERAFNSHRLTLEQVTVYGTYRRLAFLAQVPEQQPDLEEEIKGPPATIAKDDAGNYLPPALGFAKKLGLDASSLSIKTIDGKDYVVAQRFSKGQPTTTLLEDILVSAIKHIQLPVAMKWGSAEFEFIRPIQWICCLFNEKPIPVTLFDKTASNITHGHRMLTQNDNPSRLIWGQEIVLKEASSYKETLRETGHVIVDHIERKELIEKELTTQSDQLNPELINEVTFLVEAPTVLKGRFDKAYLKLPKEILADSMEGNQKYFPIYTKGTLTNEYLMAAEAVTERNKDAIIQGNNRVLRARLSDLDFFWQEDQKQPLKRYLDKLKTVTYQKNLGTLYDKTQRIIALSSWLAKTLTPNLADAIIETATLAKADLSTTLVFEAPNLQGTIGRYYAQNQGLDQLVAQGIEDHYKPRFADDTLPETITGSIVGMADRLDSIVSCFANGYRPSGSQDPLGVRRAFFGLLKLILHSEQDISLNDCLNQTYAVLDKENNPSQEELTNFANSRIKQFFIDELGVAYDCVDATLHLALNSPKQALTIAQQLEELKADEATIKPLTESAVRVARLAEKTPKQVLAIDETLFETQEEKDLWQFVKELPTPLPISQLIGLTVPLTAFFDNVLVMSDNDAIRLNRLSLLKTLDQRIKSQANFEKLTL